MFSLHVVISTLWLYITVTALESTNTAVKLSYSWTEIKSSSDESPLDHDGKNRNHHSSLKTFFVGENNHSLALLRWHNISETHPRAVNLTVRTHTFDGQGWDKVCDIVTPPEDETKVITPTSVAFLRGDRVLLAWGENHVLEGYQLRLQVIRMDTCTSSDYVYIKVLLDSRYDGVLKKMSDVLDIAINDHLAKFSDTFEIFVTYPMECPRQVSDDVACTLSFNYDGTPLTPKLEVIANLSKMVVYEARGMTYSGGQGYVFVTDDEANGFAWFGNARYTYSPIEGWTDIGNSDLLVSTWSYSNSSGFASLCWGEYNGEIHCRWLDGRQNLNESLIAKVHPDYWDTSMKGLLFNNRNFFMGFSTINSPNGRVVFIHVQYNDGSPFLVAEEIQSNGQCKRVAKIRVPIFPEYLESVKSLTIVSVGSQNQYCFSYVTERLLAENTEIYEDTFTTQCAQVLDRASIQLHTCAGKN